MSKRLVALVALILAGLAVACGGEGGSPKASPASVLEKLAGAGA